MSTSEMVAELETHWRREADPERAVNEKAYLKSPIQHHGVRVPAIRAAVRSVTRAHGEPSHRGLLALARRLWSSRFHENRMAAVIVLEDYVDRLEPADLALLEKMIRGSFTWAYVDGLAATVAGTLVERHPELVAELDRWARDDSFWVRRGAMLALMGPLRRGGGDWDRFVRFADGMLDEREFFIRKAIGWVLRETSKKRPALVIDFVRPRLARLSGVTFREAVKRLPEARRKELRAAYEEARR